MNSVVIIVVLNVKQLVENTTMDWMDFNRDGEVDAAEMYLAEEMLCSSKEEHEALFGDAGDFEDDEYEDE